MQTDLVRNSHVEELGLLAVKMFLNENRRGRLDGMNVGMVGSRMRT